MISLLALAASSQGSFGAQLVSTFSDEFTATSLDPSKWEVVTQRNFFGGHPSCIDRAEMISAANGSLLLSADKATITTPQGDLFHYQAGRIESKDTILYGHVEFRARMPEGKGFFPALWLQSAKDVPPAQYEEIDVFETRGSNSFGFASHVWPKGQPLGMGNKSGILVGKPNYGSEPQGYLAYNPLAIEVRQWHVYGLNWYPDRCEFLVDGKAVGSVPVAIHQPLRIVLNNALNSDDGEPAEATKLPQAMEVDFVRAWPL